MRKVGSFVLMFVLLMTLIGCCAEKPQKEAEHNCGQTEALPRYDIVLSIPADASEVMAFSGENCRVYAQEDGNFTIMTQILQADSLDALLKELAGQNREDLTVLTTWYEGMPRHELSWVSAGEVGLEVSRAVILDDGRHYYTAVLTAPEALAWENGVQDCFSGIRLTRNQEVCITAP